MLAFNITDVKTFMNKLLIGDVFDQFWLTEASITTFNVFTIDGKLQQDFFDTSEREVLDASSRTCSLWKDVKPFCYSIIRGKHTPLHFKIVLQLPHSSLEQLAARPQSESFLKPVAGFYLNLQYKNNSLLCTTGASLKTFVPGKEAEHFWDSMVTDFFRRSQIPYEQL